MDIEALLPPPGSLKALVRLRAPVTVYRRARSILGPTGLWTVLWLGDPDSTLRLTVKDHGLACKFEVFELVANEEPLPPSAERIEVTNILGWDAIRCLFRFEWTRPAIRGELPSHYEQIIGESGKSDAIPNNALHGAVTMVGIAFWNEVRNAPVAGVLDRGDDPFSLRVLDHPEKTATALEQCEIVRPDDIPALKPSA